MADTGRELVSPAPRARCYPLLYWPIYKPPLREQTPFTDPKPVKDRAGWAAPMHINLLSHDYFYQLRQLCSVTRSLNASATSSLVLTFITNRLDDCCSLYADVSACWLWCLDRVLRSAARLIGGTPTCKFVHVSRYTRDVLDCPPAKQRSSYRFAWLVWRCLLGQWPCFCLPSWALLSSP